MYIKLFTLALAVEYNKFLVLTRLFAMLSWIVSPLNLYKGQTSVVLYRPYTAQLALLNPPTKLFEFI